MGGVLLISSGILFLGLRSLSNEKSIPALVFALTTGILIAAYSVTDGFGVRLTENPLLLHSLAIYCGRLCGILHLWKI